MDIREAILTRRSVRKFQDRPVASCVIDEMLEAARRAPTPGNGQGNVFGVVTDPAVRLELARAAGNQLWIAQAPVVFAGCARIDWDIARLPEDDFGLAVNRLRFGKTFIDAMCALEDRRTCTTLFANGGPSIAMEHIFLTAVSHGMSACFIGYLDIERADAVLNLPSDLTCLFLMPVGYAAEEPRPKELKSLKDIAFYDRWQA